MSTCIHECSRALQRLVKLEGVECRRRCAVPTLHALLHLVEELVVVGFGDLPCFVLRMRERERERERERARERERQGEGGGERERRRERA